MEDWPHVLCTHIKSSTTVCCVHMDNYSELLNITGVRCLCWKHQNGLAVKHKRIEKQISMILSFLQAFLHLFSLSQVFRVINGLINLILDLNYPCLAGRQLSQPNAYACIPHTLPSSEISNLFNTLKVGTSQLNLNYSLKLRHKSQQVDKMSS